MKILFLPLFSILHHKTKLSEKLNIFKFFFSMHFLHTFINHIQFLNVPWSVMYSHVHVLHLLLPIFWILWNLIITFFMSFILKFLLVLYYKNKLPHKYFNDTCCSPRGTLLSVPRNLNSQFQKWFSDLLL